jgi:hypothetical protein
LRGLLTAALILTGAVAIAVFLHGLDIAAEGPEKPRAAAPGPQLAAVRDWRYEHIDPATGALVWVASGRTALPDGPARVRVDAPRYESYGPKPLTATAEAASASFPKNAETVIHFERAISVEQASWRFGGDDIVLTIPRDEAQRLEEDRAVLVSARPVTLEMSDVHGSFRGAGLQASAERQRAVLAPPVAGRVDAAALAQARGAAPERFVRPGDVVEFETDAPVEIVEVREAAYDVKLTGPARARLIRRGAAIPYDAVDRAGGTIHLVAPKGKGSEAGKEPDGALLPGLRGARAAAELHGGVEVKQGETLLAWGERLLWDGAAEVATLTGGPGREAELHAPEKGASVRAETIRYLLARGEAELEGAVAGEFPYRPEGPEGAAPAADSPRAKLAGTWRIAAPRARVAFDGQRDVRWVEATAAAAGPVRVEHREDGAAGEAASARYEPAAERVELRAARGGPPARFRRGASALAAREIVVDRRGGLVRLAGDVEADLASELWGGAPPLSDAPALREGSDRSDGGERARLAGSDWHVESDELVVRFAPVTGTVTAIELVGRDRQALLRSRPNRPGDPSYEVAGARIAADRSAGLVAVLPAPGGSPRQTLARGRDRLEAREVRYDEARGVATAIGEAIYRRDGAAGEPPLRAEAAEVELRLTAGRKPARVEARGAPGRPVVVVREDEKRPVRLVAPRIAGFFDAATGKLATATVEGDGGPVVIEPAYTAPLDERFRLTGSRITYDAASGTGEVFGLAGPPEVVRGEGERLTAERLTFDIGALTVSLRGGIHGRFRAKVPALGGRGAGPGKAAQPAAGESLFDLDADEADLSLAGGVPSVEARGHVHFRDKGDEIRADRARYDRESSTVTLEGRPVQILRGGKYETAPRVLTIRLTSDHP